MESVLLTKVRMMIFVLTLSRERIMESVLSVRRNTDA